MLRIFQKGFNFSQDGDGNRLVYHLQGCNMRCPWCSNPEGMEPGGALLLDREWLFDAVCPRGAVRGGELDRTRCADCASRPCTEQGGKALRLSCWEAAVQEVLEEIARSRPMFYGGGGVTFTGGEPTMQFDALAEVLAGARERHIHTAIETNGTHARLPELFPLLDQLIMDCKQCVDGKHRAATGAGSGAVLENLRRAAAEHPRVHIRVPVIGGVNDGEDDLAAFLRFFTGIAGENTTFEVLAYHEYGRVKWEQCGYPYRMTGGFAPEAAERMRRAIREAGLRYQAT